MQNAECRIMVADLYCCINQFVYRKRSRAIKISE